MTYVPPTITASGLTIPTYQDLIGYLVDQTVQIYGQGEYLQPDSADYQALSIFALLLSDALQAMQLVYFNRAPMSAIGSGLDGIVKLNGMARQQASYSQCVVTISGTAGTTINNGSVRDTNGLLWDLPSTVTIGGTNTASATATCEVLGAINAAPNTLIYRNTPTAGWTDVTNPNPAIPGNPIELDATLRARQAVSVALPSLTRLQGTIAGIAQTKGVTRYNVQENFTNISDQWGNPPHSITCTVEGGAPLDVATTIYLNKSIGCYTNGTTAINVPDPVTGTITVIRFNTPTYIQFTVVCNIHVFVGSTSYWQSAVQTALVNYMISLQIGEMLTIASLTAVAMKLNPDITNPQFTVRLMQTGYTSCVIAATLGAAHGTGYVVGDILSISQVGSSSTAQVAVTAVAAGVVSSIGPLLQNGVGYVAGNNLNTILVPNTAGGGGAGAGCQINITVGTVTDNTDKGVSPTQVVQGVAGNVTVSIV